MKNKFVISHVPYVPALRNRAQVGLVVVHPLRSQLPAAPGATKPHRSRAGLRYEGLEGPRVYAPRDVRVQRDGSIKFRLTGARYHQRNGTVRRIALDD